MRGVVVLMCLVGCVRSNAQICDDGRVCPEGKLCAETTVEGLLCVDPDQLAQCADKPDGTACRDGTWRCYEEVCLPGGCGNQRADTADGEACDDGNNSAGDGCAADCRSNEQCGNGVLDGVNQEQCDDGDELSGDGCSSACTPETFRIVQDIFNSVQTFTNTAWAYDAARDRLVVFDSGTTLEFDGAWTNPQFSHTPRTRFGARMAWDAKRRRVVLFGGSGVGALTPFADTWSYDGAVWTQ